MRRSRSARRKYERERAGSNCKSHFTLQQVVADAIRIDTSAHGRCVYRKPSHSTSLHDEAAEKATNEASALKPLPTTGYSPA